MKTSAYVLIVMLGVAACNPPADSKVDSKTISPSKAVSSETDETNVITFIVGKEPVRTTGWTISRFSLNNEPGKLWLNITSNMHDEKRTINVNLDGAATGTYSFGTEGRISSRSHGSYYPDYIEDITNAYSFTEGNFHITEIDTMRKLVSGTFWGTVKNPKGETFKITGGRIRNGLLNSNIVRY